MNNLLKFLQKFQPSSFGIPYCSLILLSLCFVSPSFAQDQHEIDSLQKLLPSITIDSSRIKILNSLSAQIVDINPAQSINYATEALALAETSKNKRAIASSLHNIGNGNYNLAEYKIALSFYIKALKIQEYIGNKRGILSSSGAIGNVLLTLKQPYEAIKYYNQTMAIATELKSKGGIATTAIAIGNVYSDKNEHRQALVYFFQSLKLFQEIGYKEAIATCYNNLADSYQQLNELPKALLYVNKAYDIYSEIGNVYGMALALNNIGDFYEKTDKNDKALEYYKRGLEQAKKIEADDRILAAYKGISKTHKKMGHFKEALAINELYQQMNDSIYNTESSKQIAEMQARFETEKKGKEIDLLTKDKKIREVELARQRFISWSMAIGACLVFLLALVAIRGYVQKRKVNNELAIKNEKIETAYSIIEDQHKDIKDSIRYAKRIQEAILPTATFSNTFKENAFVLYKPKDIVSGDFYWIETIGHESSVIGSGDKNSQLSSLDSFQILFAAVDCTGHGVPGAFMSIVGHNLLNQVVNEHHKTKPADILNELNVGLSATLRQTVEESTVKDGMDIALCSLQKNKSNSYTLQFAGANNPVWIIREKTNGNETETENNYQLIEIKGDKFPIGIFVGEELNKFNNREVELLPGDTLYIFTDGFSDQFGGPKGKKFKYKPLQKLLLSIQNQAMNEQCEILNKTLIEWKGDLEQVDDVLIIGIKI